MKNIFLKLANNFYYKPLDLRKILENFNIKDVLSLKREAFFKLEIHGKALDNFLLNRLDKTYKNDPDIKMVTILDKEYPKKLKNIYDAPPILFYKGNLEILDELGIAVIGSRKITDYGKKVCEDFVNVLSKKILIISGLAYGIDGLAHKKTLDNSGKTIAVLGSGLDIENIYPRSNLQLANDIVTKGGLLLSEVPPGIGPQAFHFPMRNRIIAGLAEGILIIEGNKKSGTLITAKLGIDYGKDIFAVPNSIYHLNSEGVNYLIKCGATPVTSPKDILDFYGMDDIKQVKEYIPKSDKEKLILDNLENNERYVDELRNLTGLEIIDLMGALTELEMAGVVKQIEQKYIKV